MDGKPTHANKCGTICSIVFIENKVSPMTPLIATSEQGDHQPCFPETNAHLHKCRGEVKKPNQIMQWSSDRQTSILSITGPCRSSCKVNQNHPKPDQTRRQVPSAKKKIKRTQTGSPAIVYGDPATPISESLAKADVASHSSAEATSESGLPR